MTVWPGAYSRYSCLLPRDFQSAPDRHHHRCISGSLGYWPIGHRQIVRRPLQERLTVHRHDASGDRAGCALSGRKVCFTSLYCPACWAGGLPWCIQLSWPPLLKTPIRWIGQKASASSGFGVIWGMLSGPSLRVSLLI